ncbi:uncharacterized protein LOC142234760 [Haematobia irritans]|uniref:uncharacterized protein LOC142234760 n=1 Tax=Haematobia irritans TaxID=7368 RepID=UPI003F50B7A9
MPDTKRRSIKTKKIFCVECKLEVEKSDESIECDKCNNTFHVVCTELNKRQFNHLMEHEEDEFECHKCSNKNNDNNDESVQTQLALFRTEMKDQLGALHNTMNFMSQQYDSILKDLAVNKKRVETIEKENKMLKQEVTELKTSIKLLNDERVKNDCVISGILPNSKLTAAETVVKISEKAGVKMEDVCISEAYFLKQRNENEKKTIIVKFDSKKSKDALMSAKPILKQSEETKNIYVNDFLSKETLNLFNYAKSLKHIGYRAVFTIGGKVFAKRSELSRGRIIRDMSDVDKILEEAATYKPPKSRSVQVLSDKESEENFVSPK